MLDTFFQNHDYLIAHSQNSVRRKLMDEIDWSQRLIAIKGSRGTGKTNFLIQYAKEYEQNHPSPTVAYGQNTQKLHKCLYVNFNNFYFSNHSLVEFAAEFVMSGGEVLLLDQIFKYPNWSAELRECYDRFPTLHIVFSGSPVMRLIEGNEDIKDIVSMYNLRGFSFREYINLKTGKHFQPYTFQQIIQEHESITREILKELNPLWYFNDYLHHGYYPFILEQRSYNETMLKTMNMMLEVDILIIKQIETGNLQKLRRLLNELLETTPCAPNISHLAKTIDMSRATAMNYIKCLKDARLLNLLYVEGKSYPQKPYRIYMQNTNLLYALPTRQMSGEVVAKTFFYNALHGTHKVYASDRGADFVIETDTKHKYNFNVFDRPPAKQSFRLSAINNLELGNGNQIPLWLFGFLY